MPEWLKRAEKETRAPAVEQNVPEKATAAGATEQAPVESKRVDGVRSPAAQNYAWLVIPEYSSVCEFLSLEVCRWVLDLQVRYNLWVGTQLHLYSSSDQETTLRNMHEPNHRELAISKYAARAADFLWPGVQDDVDEAIAKGKEMNAGKRIGVEEIEEFVPPEVPHLLPFSNWCVPGLFQHGLVMSAVLVYHHLSDFCGAPTVSKESQRNQYIGYAGFATRQRCVSPSFVTRTQDTSQGWLGTTPMMA